MAANSSSSSSPSNGGCPTSISYSSTPYAHQSTDLPYGWYRMICNPIEWTHADDVRTDWVGLGYGRLLAQIPYGHGIRQVHTNRSVWTVISRLLAVGSIIVKRATDITRTERLVMVATGDGSRTDVLDRGYGEVSENGEPRGRVVRSKRRTLKEFRLSNQPRCNIKIQLQRCKGLTKIN